MSLGNHADYDSLSMEDSKAIDSDAVDGVEASGDSSLNDLRQMGRVLHRYDVFESFFDDLVGGIEWERDDGDEGLSEKMADSAE